MAGRILHFKVEIDENQEVYLVDGVRVPRIVLKQGDKAIFDVNVPGYPFCISTEALRCSNAEGVEVGEVIFHVDDAEEGKQYYYTCSKVENMGHKIVIQKL